MYEKVRKYGDLVLSRVSQSVTRVDDCEGYVRDLMTVYEYLNSPQGLAAPQIGLSKRIVLCRLKGKLYIMLNPVIVARFGSKKSNEGCESVKGRFIVKRPLFGKVTYQTREGFSITKWYTWRRLRVICHEVDHLNGICINDIGKEWKQ